MSGHQRHAQLAAEQQHDRQRRAGSSREIFGVADERVAGVHERALLHRRGHHGGEFAVHTAVAGAVQHLDHVGGVARIRLPGDDGRRVGMCMTLRVPARCAFARLRGVVALEVAAAASGWPAVAASKSVSAATTRSASQSVCARPTQASGPIPAGSPEVMTMRGMYTAARAYILISTKASSRNRAQPQLGLFVRLALADGGERTLAAHVVGAVVGASAQHLHDVPAVAGLERLADLVDLEIRDCLVEFRHEGAGTAPAQVAAVRRRARILGRGARRCRRNPRLSRCARAACSSFCAHRFVVIQLVRLHQDVADVDLIDDHLRLAAAPLVELHDVKAARRAHRLR